ncbi:toxin-activating lysine-acyltransferase [Halomonas elongata]|uniref:toxin-activating lysine-acyltransferase n=1 Tax=Halomonas elongata TaxID=2746 RepID=UPI0038D43766
MIYSYTNNCKQASQDDIFNKLGFVISVMNQCNLHSNLRIINIKKWMFQPIIQNQISLLENSWGEPVSYYCWAYLDINSVRRMLEDPSYVLHPSEWDEGNILWIIDICTHSNYLRPTLREISHRFQDYFDILYWESHSCKKNRIGFYNFSTHRIDYCGIDEVLT